jgi:hypothetical protein
MIASPSGEVLGSCLKSFLFSFGIPPIFESFEDEGEIALSGFYT